METLAASAKPKPVLAAQNLLWASLGVGPVKLLLDHSQLSAVASAGFIIFTLVLTVVWFAFLVFKISAGRNWARITFLVMFIIGVLPTIPIVLGEFSRSVALGALSVAQIGLQGLALFLLFTQPGSGWFRRAGPV